MVSKREILSLYKRILKTGNETIKYTNKEYFRRRIREEFEMADEIVGDKKQKDFIRNKMYEKGVEFLEKKIGGII